MFDGISGTYDRLNRFITFGIDLKWRRRMMKYVAETKPGKILDIATGTGDLLLLAAEKTRAGEITGADISEGMLEIGKRKVAESPYRDRIKLQLADAEDLPYGTGYFDVVTVAFGVRNFEDLDKGLNEIKRVLRAGGRLVILETSVPGNALIRRLYNFHSRYLLPRMGKIFAGDATAYRYLSESAKKFPYGQAFHNKLTGTGFINVQTLPQTFGAAAIYIAEKPSES